MIASLSGLVTSIGMTNAVIEVGGVGILVQISTKSAASLEVGKNVTIHTSLVVREDALTLFGFNTASARDLFEKLQSVSGIGPKVSQSALSIFDPEELISAINAGENSLLEKIPGLGKKGAQRLILELKDKLASGKATPKSDWRVPLESALSGLGFTGKEIEKLLTQINKELANETKSLSPSELLKLALQIKGRA